MRKSLIQFMALLLVALPLLGVFADKTSAASSRVAVIKELKGTVKVKKSGGSKEFTAFAKLSLNEGDILNVGSGGSAVLQFSNGTSEDDKMTVSSSTTMTFSKLSNNKGTVTKVSILSGSVWSTVKSIANKNDEFTLETPTAIMGVRGTNLLVGVDPETGESKFYIASGVGQISKKGDEGPGSETTLNANEQISMDDQSENLDDFKNIADLDDLVILTSNAIIEAIISSKAAIDKENDAYIAKLQNQIDSTGSTTTLNQETIDRINSNLNNLVGNIVKTAIKQKKVDETSIKAFIEKINEQLDKKLDLDKVKAQELSEKEKVKQEELKKLEAEKLAKQEAEKKKQEELKKKNEELIKKLNAEKVKQDAAKKKTLEEQKAKAQAEYEKQLDEVKKKQFEEDKKSRELELKQQGASPSPSSNTGPSLSSDASLTNILVQSAGNRIPSPSETSSPSPSETSSPSPSETSSPSPSETSSPSPTQIAITPSLNGSTVSYSATVAYNITSINVKGITSESNATIKVNGIDQASAGNIIELNDEISTPITFIVTAQNGTTKTYTLTVWRPSLLNDVKIANFDVPEDITYDPVVLDYSFTLNEYPTEPYIFFEDGDIPDDTTISVTFNNQVIEAEVGGEGFVLSEDNTIYYKLYGNEGSYALEGSNILTIDVHRTGHAITRYTFNVDVNLPDYRDGLSSWEATLDSLASPPVVVPIQRLLGHSDQYYIELPADSSTFDLSMDFGSSGKSATLSDINFNEADGYTHTINSLCEGYNYFQIQFNDHTIDFTVIVDNVLENVSLDESNINYADNNQYTANVASDVNSVALYAGAQQSSSKVKIYQGNELIAPEGCGDASAEIALEEGWNEYTIKVTDRNGLFTRIYHLSIWQESEDGPNPFL
jgi:hypothetical protein